jgi:GxxExxY protein
MDAFTPEMREAADELSRRVIGAAIEVHRHLGPGLLESAYEACLCRELDLQGMTYQRQLPVPVLYKGLELDCSYQIDVLVEGLVLVELKSVDTLEPIHKAQVITYLTLTKRWLGLLVNFNVPVLKDGVKRIVKG